jgi:hypothetical protein
MSIPYVGQARGLDAFGPDTTLEALSGIQEALVEVHKHASAAKGDLSRT